MNDLIHNSDGTLSTVEDGHHFAPAPDDPKRINHWVVEYDYHNGPECILCDDSWCHHCEELDGHDIYAEQCPVRQQELSLDG